MHLSKPHGPAKPSRSSDRARLQVPRGRFRARPTHRRAAIAAKVAAGVVMQAIMSRAKNSRLHPYRARRTSPESPRFLPAPGVDSIQRLPPATAVCSETTARSRGSERQTKIDGIIFCTFLFARSFFCSRFLNLLLANTFSYFISIIFLLFPRNR